MRDNHLCGSDFSSLSSLYPQLAKLKIGKNSIKGIEVFKPLSSLKSLRKIEYLENFNNERREEMFKMIPSLEVINGLAASGEEIESTLDIEGKNNI